MAAAAPVIGITAYEEKATWGVWDSELAAIVPSTYVQAVIRAGGLPVLLPVQVSGAEELVSRLDGVLLTGGPDVDPARYGAEAHPRTQRPRRERDGFEIDVLDAAAGRELPVLAICRGLQTLNVARGGTLHQHVPDLVGDDRHGTGGVYAPTEVRVDPDSKLAGLLGKDTAEGLCHHHQAVDRIGDNLVAVAWAPDGTIEGLEDPGTPFTLAVQWHPEVGSDPSLFEALVAAASA
jgi:putative glutamine amidotransferase